MSIKLSSVQASHLRRLKNAESGLPAGANGWGHKSAMESLERRGLASLVTNKDGFSRWIATPAAENFL